MPGNSNPEGFPLPVYLKRNFRLLFAKATIERISEWGGAETTPFVDGDIRSTFQMKIVPESVVVGISHSASVRLMFF